MVSPKTPLQVQIKFPQNITPGCERLLIDLKSEDIITFVEAIALVPTRPPVSVSTISRWCTTGCRGIKLESVFVGGRRKTTRQALERFLLACRERRWAGIHGNTAYALEQALAEQGFMVEQPQDDDPSHTGPAHPTGSKTKTTRSRRRTSRSKGTPALGQRQKRRTR